MPTTAIIELALIALQHLAAVLFVVAGVEALSQMLSLPRGPMGRVFRGFALGALGFGAMAVSWSLEDAVPLLDTVTDVLFIVALAVTMRAYVSLLALKLSVEE